MLVAQTRTGNMTLCLFALVDLAYAQLLFPYHRLCTILPIWLQTTANWYSTLLLLFSCELLVSPHQTIPLCSVQTT